MILKMKNKGNNVYALSLCFLKNQTQRHQGHKGPSLFVPFVFEYKCYQVAA